MDIVDRQISKIKVSRRFSQRLPPSTKEEKKRLQDSIEKNGVIVPMLISKDGILIDGHRRYEAAKANGVKRVPTIKLPVGGNEDVASLIDIVVAIDHRDLNPAVRSDLGSSLLRIEQREAKKRKGVGAGRPKESGGNSAPQIKRKEQDRSTDRVAKRVGVSRKTFERVQKVKKKDPQLAKKMLTGGIKVAGAFNKVKAKEIKQKARIESKKLKVDGKVRKLSEVFGKCRTVYMDPPWAYGDSGTRGAAAGHYPTMTVKELAKLPVNKLGNPNGCLYWIWTTWPKIRDKAPHELLDKWGLRWVGEVVWHKLGGPGTGRWLRPTTEILILAVSGKKEAALMDDKNLSAFLETQKGKHSEKPEKAYELIERLSPEPRIELFARGKSRNGWWRYGYEA